MAAGRPREGRDARIETRVGMDVRDALDKVQNKSEFIDQTLRSVLIHHRSSEEAALRLRVQELDDAIRRLQADKSGVEAQLERISSEEERRRTEEQRVLTVVSRARDIVQQKRLGKIGWHTFCRANRIEPAVLVKHGILGDNDL